MTSRSGNNKSRAAVIANGIRRDASTKQELGASGVTVEARHDQSVDSGLVFVHRIGTSLQQACNNSVFAHITRDHQRAHPLAVCGVGLSPGCQERVDNFLPLRLWALASFALAFASLLFLHLRKP